MAMGLSATLLLGDLEIFKTVVGQIAPVLLDAGLFLLFPLVFIMFSSGVASLRRQEKTALAFSTTILWSILTAVLFSCFAAAMYLVLPFGVDNITTTGVDVSTLDSIGLIQPENFFSLLIAKNSFIQFIVTDRFLLPLLLMAFLLGLALKPDVEAIRPAYVVMNAFSEALLRLSRLFTTVGAVFIGIIGCDWFNHLDAEPLFFDNLSFFAGIGIVLISILFILMPLLYWLLTKGKGGNPYRILFGALPAYVAAFFTGNILYAATPLIALSRQNNGVRKSIAGTAIPLYTILGKGGSAAISTVTVISLMISTTGLVPAWQTLLTIALLCSLFSMVSSFNIGYEVLFIVVMVLRVLNIDLQGSQMMVIALLPLLNGFGTLLDTAISAFGATYTSRLLAPNDIVAYRDMI